MKGKRDGERKRVRKEVSVGDRQRRREKLGMSAVTNVTVNDINGITTASSRHCEAGKY